uniref:Uncharacterized protein n=1 Tax=Micrurus spixii TaxID=129469 RepID=A0A2D4M538_9SAUR
MSPGQNYIWLIKLLKLHIRLLKHCSSDCSCMLDNSPTGWLFWLQVLEEVCQLLPQICHFLVSAKRGRKELFWEREAELRKQVNFGQQGKAVFLTQSLWKHYPCHRSMGSPMVRMLGRRLASPHLRPECCHGAG